LNHNVSCILSGPFITCHGAFSGYEWRKPSPDMQDNYEYVEQATEEERGRPPVWV